LVTLDGISETVSALLAWLSTAESYLSEAKSVLGDVDTVGVLMQQHQVCAALFVGFHNGTFISACTLKQVTIFHI